MTVKEPFTRFALRFPLTLGLGAVLLLLHDALSGGVVPHNEDRLLKIPLVRGIHHHDPSGNAFHHPRSCLLSLTV